MSPTNAELKQAIRDFTTVNPIGWSSTEMVNFLKLQKSEMRREPDNQAALASILEGCNG